MKSVCMTVVTMMTRVIFFLKWNGADSATSYNVQSYLKTESPEIKISKNIESSRANLRIGALTTMNKQRLMINKFLNSEEKQEIKYV